MSTLPKATQHIWYNPYQNINSFLGAPGWLSHLSVGLLILDQVMVSWFVGSSPMLTAQSLLGILALPLPCSLHSLSQNKLKKNSNSIFHRVRINNHKMCMEQQKTLMAKAILKKKSKVGGIKTPDFVILQSCSDQRSRHRSIEQKIKKWTDNYMGN